MADSKTQFESLLVRPSIKTSVKIIHAGLHGKALTLAALAGAAVVECHDHKTEAKDERYAKHFTIGDFTSGRIHKFSHLNISISVLDRFHFHKNFRAA